jgi:hypothetical protein
MWYDNLVSFSTQGGLLPWNTQNSMCNVEFFILFYLSFNYTMATNHCKMDLLILIHQHLETYESIMANNNYSCNYNKLE